jgi:hypothetical protein
MKSTTHEVFLPSFLHFSFFIHLPSFLPSFIFLPSFLYSSSFLPSYLPSYVVFIFCRHLPSFLPCFIHSFVPSHPPSLPPSSSFLRLPSFHTLGILSVLPSVCSQACSQYALSILSVYSQHPLSHTLSVLSGMFLVHFQS